MRCEFCDFEHGRGPKDASDECPSCLLYNTAVAAQRAAAASIAKALNPRCVGAWLNEYGVFAWLDNHTVQVGTPAMATPFVQLTSAVRSLKAEDFRLSMGGKS